MRIPKAPPWLEESSFPNLQHLGGVFEVEIMAVEVPSVEKAVSDPCSEDGANCHIDKLLIRPVVGALLVSVDTAESS